MLDQYQGTLLCIVNYNDGSFAECDIVDAVSLNPEASIHDEFWLGASRVQVHADLLNLDEEQFLARYPLGKEFRMELTVRVIDQAPCLRIVQPLARSIMPVILRQRCTFTRNQFLNFLYIKIPLQLRWAADHHLISVHILRTGSC